MSSSHFLVLRPEFSCMQGQDPQKTEPPLGSRNSDQQTGTGTEQVAPPNTGNQPVQDPCADSWWMILAMVLVFYFLLIRPQQKQEKARRALLAAVSKGDKVVTNSGMHGTITALTEDKVTLRVDKDIKLTFDRSSIGRKLDSEQEAEKS
ncbi:MAG: preprotein translocase subunit YajC [Planctomycetota bacterium]|jgi:preprotein translocase subunit YajC